MPTNITLPTSIIEALINTEIEREAARLTDRRNTPGFEFDEDYPKHDKVVALKETLKVSYLLDEDDESTAYVTATVQLQHEIASTTIARPESAGGALVVGTTPVATTELEITLRARGWHKHLGVTRIVR